MLVVLINSLILMLWKTLHIILCEKFLFNPIILHWLIYYAIALCLRYICGVGECLYVDVHFDHVFLSIFTQCRETISGKDRRDGVHKTGGLAVSA